MASINYKNLNLKKVVNSKSFDFNGQKIEILDCISIEDMYDIVMITLQKSAEGGIYNPIKLDIFYHLNLVYAFTNLVFNDEDREDELKLYDELTSSGFMNAFLSNFNEELYAEMQNYIDYIANLLMDYNKSVASIINKFIDDLPANAEAMQSIVENFEPEKYQAVLDFAKAANGGRQIR